MIPAPSVDQGNRCQNLPRKCLCTMTNPNRRKPPTHSTGYATSSVLSAGVRTPTCHRLLHLLHFSMRGPIHPSATLQTNHCTVLFIIRNGDSLLVRLVATRRCELSYSSVIRACQNKVTLPKVPPAQGTQEQASSRIASRPSS